MPGPSNPEVMATTHAQITVAHDVQAVPVAQGMPTSASPTLMNPDLILPEEHLLSASSTTLSSGSVSQSGHHGDTSPKGHKRGDSDGTTELLTATAVVMPQRLSVQPTTIKASAAATLAAYAVYEHGTPLSDIGEEESDSDSTTRGDKSRVPSPSEDGTISSKKLRLRPKKRLSNISSSSGGSDIGAWEEFDTSKLGSDRVAADIAHARESADNDDSKSRRDSKEIDEELALLNERAEKILASARKRLTHMEDNLSKARHSIALKPSHSTPNMHEVAQPQLQAQAQPHQPAGALYRSISQNAHRKSRGNLPVKPSSPLSHVRTGSDNVVPSGMKRLSRMPEVRSASALDYGRPMLGGMTPEGTNHPHSPGSSRSFSSPLRVLTEEDVGSPSTVKTSPDITMQPFTAYRGLGLRSNGTKGQEDSEQSHYESSSTPTSLDRSNSQASTRSARELTEKISEMKTRIAELKSKAQADSMKRKSIQSLREESPFNGSSGNGNDSIHYPSSSPENQDRAIFSLGHTVGAVTEWRSHPHSGHQRKDSALDDDDPVQNPVTPVTTRFPNTDTTPVAFSSARTDRNTLNLTKRRLDVDENLEDADLGSMIQTSNYVDAEQDFPSDEEDDVAVNEEEQVYLNEVLEESLQDLEPVVPAIPGEYLAHEIVAGEGLSHEDRLDAFDYENMFLHSAMGTYTGKRDGDDESDNDSTETSRQDMQTPTLGDDDDDDTSDDQDDEDLQDGDDSCSNDDEIETDEEMESALRLQQRLPEQPPLRNPLRDEAQHVKQIHIRELRKPWMSLGRSNSVESNASTATFQTATENLGTPEDESPEEILNWGNAPAQGQAVYIQPRSPIRAVQINSPPRRHPRNNGSIPELANGQNYGRSSSNSLLKSVVTGNLSPTPPRPRSASGQYRIFPSPLPQSPTDHRTKSPEHSRDTSISSNQKATPRASTFPTHDQSQPSSPHPQSPKSPQSPQLPQSPSLNSHPHFHRHTRSTSSQISTSSNGSAQLQPVKANTTILMESLIKLADPNFAMDPNTHFEEVDKELVLALLRAVGGVSEEMLRAQAYGDGGIVRELRRRLGKATGVLVAGGEEE